MSIFSIAGSTPSDEGFELKSARFNGADAAYLSRTPESDGNRRTWTYSCWFKKCPGENPAGLASCLYVAQNAASETNATTTLIYILPAGTHEDRLRITGATTQWRTTTKMFRDPSAWYHLVVTLDTTKSVALDRWKIWINGIELTSFETSNNPSQNEELGINSTSLQSIGKYDTQQYYDGYLAEAYMVDGTALTPSSFAATNEDTNQWQPKNPTDIKQAVTFGTNGFYLPFSNDALATSFTDASLPTVFTPTEAITADVMIIAGGGGGI